MCLLLGVWLVALALCPPAAAAPEARFERLGPPGGTVRSLLISPHDGRNVYLGTSDGQLFKSTDGGASWKLLYPGIKRRQLVIDVIVEHPSDGNRIYAGGWDLRSSGGGLYESRDAGNSWTQVKLPKTDAAVRGFAVSKREPAYMIAGTLSGVYLTADGGKTWRQSGAGIESFRQVESVAIDPHDHQVLYVGTWHLGFRSTDFGRTWRRNDRGMISDSDVFSITVDERDTKTVYASACTGLYRSADRGISWTRLKVFPKSFLVRAQVVCLDPTDSSRVYGGTTEGLFVSRNSGRTWTRITPPDLIIHSIQVNPSDAGTILIGTESHGVFLTRDGGRTWTESNTGFASRSIARILPDPASPGRFLVGEISAGVIGGFHVYDNPVNDWVRLSEREVPGEGMLSFLALPGKLGCLAGTGKGVFLKRAVAAEWRRLPGTIARLNVYDLALDKDGKWVFAGTNDGVYRARVGDLNFEKPPGYSLIPRVFALLPSRANAARIFAGTHMGVLRSDDSGATWSVASAGIPDHTTVECLASTPADEARIFAGTTGGLYVSSDGGNTWGKSADGRLGVDVPSVIFLDSTGRRILAADNTHGGVFLSENAGSSWERLENPEFASPVRTLAADPLHPSVIYLGTATEGVYRLSLQASDTRLPGSPPTR